MFMILCKLAAWKESLQPVDTVSKGLATNRGKYDAEWHRGWVVRRGLFGVLEGGMGADQAWEEMSSSEQASAIS